MSFPVSPGHEAELIRDMGRLLFYTAERDGEIWGVGGKPSGDGQYMRAPEGEPDLVCRYTRADRRLIVEACARDAEGTDAPVDLFLLLRDALLPYAGRDRFTVPSFQPVRMTEAARLALFRAVQAGNMPIMPVVTLSLMPDGSMLWDPGKLADLLGGIAHVITPVTDKEQEMLTRTFPKYPKRGYGGAFLLGKQVVSFPLYDDPDEKEEAVRHILFDLESCIPDLTLPDWFSWERKDTDEDGTEPDAEKDAEIEPAEEGAEEILAKKDAEIAELKNRIRQSEEARRKEEACRLGLQKKLEAKDARPVLVMGKEDDLYEGEIRETVLEILREAKTDSRERTRRLDILTDLLEANPMTGVKQKMRDDLKREIKKADSVEDAKRVFARFGYREESHNGHIKLGYKDPRYSAMMAATTSDLMGYRHAAQIIARKLL